MRRNRVLGIAAVLGCVGVAQAQEERPESFELAPMQRGALLDAWSTDPLAPGAVALALGLHVRPADPAALPQSQFGSSTSAPPSLSTAEFLGTVGVFDGFDLSAGASASYSAAGADSDTRRVAWGVARVVPRLRLFGVPDAGGGALLLDGAVPLGQDTTGARDGVGLQPRVALSQVYDWAHLTLNAGYRTHVGRQPLGGSTSDAFRWSAGSELPLLGAWSTVMELSGSWYVRGAGEGWRDRSPTDAHVAARFSRVSWAAELGGGIGLLGGRNEAGWRLFAAVSVALPTLPERHPGAHTRRSTSSSLADANDECATQMANWTGRSVPSACAAYEGAERHVATAEDDCGNDPTLCGAQQTQTVADTYAESPLDLSQRLEVELHFPPNGYLPDPTQLATLDAVAESMKAAPDGIRFVVEGHSDATGPIAFNWKLSQARAVLVRRLLIERGVPWQRISVAWYGSTRPPPTTELIDDAVAIRRVEFRAEPVSD